MADGDLRAALAATAGEDGVAVCVFVNGAYGQLLANWTLQTRRVTDRPFFAVCFDEAAVAVCEAHEVRAVLRPFQGSWLAFMRHQMGIVREMLGLGYGVLASDVDAMWVRDPVPFTLAAPEPLVFSPGTVQPPRAHAAWGNVLCTGYFLMRPTSDVLHLLDEAMMLMETMGDQPALNLALLDRGLVWEPAELYAMPFRDKAVRQSRGVRRGQCGAMGVALLPNRLFQRLDEDEPEVLVVHPVTPKLEGTKVADLKARGLWRLG